jgi:hypothetical protein
VQRCWSARVREDGTAGEFEALVGEMTGNLVDLTGSAGAS